VDLTTADGGENEKHCERVKSVGIRPKKDRTIFCSLYFRSAGHDAFCIQHFALCIENVNSYLPINDKNVYVDSHSAVHGLKMEYRGDEKEIAVKSLEAIKK